MSGQQGAREFVVRAAGADRSFQKFVLGKFPLGPPDLKAPGASWRKSERDCYVAKLDRYSTRGPEARPPGKAWVLDDPNNAAAQPVLVGQPEAGMGDGGSGAGYFLLVRHRGSEEFIAMPVSEWQNFKPLVQRATNSLEEAEAEMKRKRLAAEKVNPRLAQAVKAAAAGDDGGGIAVPGDDEEHDSDAEWKDIRSRAATRQAAKPAPQRRPPARAGGMDEEEEKEDEDHAEKSDKGEDWEHEDVAADDDIDMGEGEDDPAADVSPVTRPRAGSASSDEEDNVAPAKVSRTLKRMMRQTGLEDTDEEEESEGEEESESIEDDEDLDKMATGLLQGRARSPSPGTQAAEEGASKKRKAVTPPPPGAAAIAAAAAAKKAAGAPAAAAARPEGGQQPKRARTAGVAAGVQQPARAAAATNGGAAAAAPAAATGAGASPVAEVEIRALLRQHGRMPLKDIAAHFKGKLKSSEERNAFTQLVKQIAKIDPTQSADGQKYLVLR